MMDNNNPIIRDWSDRVLPKRNKIARKSRNVLGGGAKNKPGRKIAWAHSGRKKLEAIIKRLPEVMVKISGGGKDMQSIKAHMNYISRQGQVDMENEQGNIIQGKPEVNDELDEWKGSGIPYTDGKYRQVFNIILSMPPGTNREAVKSASRLFAKELFDGHQYVFAAHEDEKHPHVHIAVKAIDKNGYRMPYPRKADLQEWREVFVEKLHENGIEANATPRWMRGITQKRKKQVIHNINKDYSSGKRSQPALVTQKEDKEIKDGLLRKNPHTSKIQETRKSVILGYKTVATALSKGNDQEKKLALGIVDFVKGMPDTKTRYEEKTKQSKEQGRDKSNDVVKKREQSNERER